MSEPISPRFFLRTFGGLSIDADSTPWNGLANQRKALGLLAVLAVAGARGVAREKLLALFWPESDTDQARNALSQLVFRVRRDLGGEVLLGSNELRLNPSFVSSDLEVLLRAVNEGHLERVADTYSGPFLDAVYLKDAPEFERWVADERTRFEMIFLQALEQLAHRAKREGNHFGAVQWTGRLVAADPLSSRAAMEHIEALVASGDRETALRFGRSYAALVRTQLETEPNPEVVQLLERIRTTVGEPPVVPDKATASRPLSTGTPVANSGFQQRTTGARRVQRRPLLATLGLSVASLTFVVVALKLGRAPDSPQTTVLVAPFENTAGDTTLNDIGRVAEAMLSEVLQRTGIVGVVDARAVMAAPKFTDSQDARQAVLSEIVDRIDARFLVAGQIFRRGVNSLELRSRVVDARSGRIVAALNPIRLRPDAPDSALRELTDRVSGALGALIDPRLASLREQGAPPPRFEAYREFAEGIDYFAGKRSQRFDYRGAIVHFSRASLLDTSWNLPLNWLAISYGNVGNQRGRDSVVAILARRRDRLVPLDRYALDYFLARRRRDDDAAYRIATAAAKLAPASNWTYLRGSWATDLQRDDEAIAAFRQLDADGGWIQSWIYFRIAFAGALHLRERFDEELRLVSEGVRRSPDPNMYGALFRAHGARGDAGAVDRLVDSIALLPDAILLQSRTAGAIGEAAAEASVHGHGDAARHLSQRCIDWQRAHPPRATPPSVPSEQQLWSMYLGHCLFILERWPEAREQYREAAVTKDWFGGMAMIRLILASLRQGDSLAAGQYIAEAHARPQFLPDSVHRGMLDALLAATSGDARGTAKHLGRVKGHLGWRTLWHGRVEISPSLRRSKEMQPLLISR